MLGRILELTWATRCQKAISSLVLTITGISGAVVAIPPALAALDNFDLPVRKSYVDTKYHSVQVVQSGTHRAVINLQIDTANGKLERHEEEKVKWEVELRNGKLSPEAAVLARQRSREIDDTIAALRRQKETLQRELEALK